MTKNKSTKRALLSSLLSLMLCVVMLVGTTFAWFTDSVTSANNRIVAGNLDVDLLMYDGEEYASIANGTGDIFDAATVAQNSNETLWEPGKTQIVYLAVENKGSLALKYDIAIDVTDNGLVGALEYAIVDGVEAGDLSVTNWAQVEASGAQIGDIVAGTTVAAEDGCLDEIVNGVDNERDYFALAVHMKEEAGNQYQGKDVVIDVKVSATQVEAENDSFDNQYDVTAPYYLPAGKTVEDFGTAVVMDENGTTYGTLQVALASNATTIYLKPEAVITKTMAGGDHPAVYGDVTIYGNNATMSGFDFSVDTYRNLAEEVTVNIHNLNGAAVWGKRKTTATVNVNLYDCYDMDRVYITGTTGMNNINIDGCTFTGSICAVYSNADGEINVTDTTFTKVGEPINLNHKAAGTQTVNVVDCTFVNCAETEIDTSAWACDIRVLSPAAGAKTVLTVKGCNFYNGGTRVNSNIFLNDTITTDNVEGTVTANIQKDETDVTYTAYEGATVTGTATENAAVYKPIVVTPDNINTVSFKETDAFYNFKGDFSGADLILKSTKEKNIILDGANASNFGEIVVNANDNILDSYSSVTTEKKGSYTIQNFNAKQISAFAYNTKMVVSNNTTEFISVYGANLGLDINKNTINGTFEAHEITNPGSGTVWTKNEYGVYLAISDYNLKFEGNTVSGAYSHAVGINGNQTPFAGAGANNGNVISSFKNNNITVNTTKKTERVALKIWDDAVYGPTNSQNVMTSSANGLVELIKNSGNTFTLGEGHMYMQFYNVNVTE